ncbi:hypothetical protein [Actinoplanes sp. NPDC051494]|uniref:hypothetical protein n=1 Tax=Actinoplanes sp. NPDC051494 TaxID=3363907 RepID=UPI0037939108
MLNTPDPAPDRPEPGTPEPGMPMPQTPTPSSPAPSSPAPSSPAPKIAAAEPVTPQATASQTSGPGTGTAKAGVIKAVSGEEAETAPGGTAGVSTPSGKEAGAASGVETTASGKTVEAETSPGGTAGPGTTPGQAVPSGTTPGQAVPPGTTPDQAVPSGTTPRGTGPAGDADGQVAGDAGSADPVLRRAAPLTSIQSAEMPRDPEPVDTGRESDKAGQNDAESAPEVEVEQDEGDPQVEAETDPEATAIIVLPRPALPPADDSDETAVIPRVRDDETIVLPARGDPAEATQVIRISTADDTQVIRTGDPDATTFIPVVPGGRTGTKAGTTAGSVPGKPAPRPARRWAAVDLGHAPAVLLMSALGVLMVALGYAGGRIGTGNDQFAYWVGQVVVFTPVVVRLLSRRMAGAAESFLLVMGLALNQYLLKWMYSPDQFRFPDELQHWLGTTVIMETGKLFQPNPALPPAVNFPGLAEMGAAIGSLTGLPVVAAGTLVAGVARMVFVATMFAVVLRASRSPAVAGVCCAIYATALHYLFFNSSYLYQTAALPFLILAVWSTRRWRTSGGWQFLSLAILSIAVATVSHHITAFALVLTLSLLAVAELVLARPRRWSALIVPGIAAAVVVTWMTTVARDVLGYLEAPVEQMVSTVQNLVNGTSEASSTTAAVSIGQLALQGAGLVALFVLYLALLRDMLQRRDRDPWRWAAIAGGALFFAGNGVRFLGQSGPEIAGRLSTFTYVPISIVAAIALVRGVQLIPERDSDGKRQWRAAAPAIDYIAPGNWNLYSRVAAGSLTITILMIGARAGGWPPIGSILPGPYLAGAFERSVDEYGVAAAYWERDTLGHANRVGGDITSVSLASTYGRQDPVREVGTLFYSDEWSLDDENLVTDLQVQYLVVDKRLGEQLPEGEAYFENDPHAGSITSPLTAQQIGKFDDLAGVDRLYDNGIVRVYRMGNL